MAKTKPAGVSDPVQAMQAVDAARHREQLRALREQYDTVVQKLGEADDRLKAFLSLRESFQSIVPVPMKVRDAKQGESTAVAVMSDWHIEERVDPRTVNGLNEFNPEIGTARVKRAFERSLSMVEMLRSRTRVETLVLALLGDFFTNRIHADLAENNYEGQTQAVLRSRDLICGGIDFLLKEGGFKRILIPATMGNHGRCHDAATQLLTKRGWKKWDEVIVGEDVATYKLDTEEAEWQPLKDLFFDEYCGDMVRVKTASADWCVTPDHRMVLREFHKNRPFVIPMGELREDNLGAKFFPRRALGSPCDLFGVTDDELRLLGWILTDGHYCRPRGSEAVGVVIYQSKLNGIAIIRDLLARLGYAYSEYRRQKPPPKIGGVQVKTCLPETTFYIKANHGRRVLDLLPSKRELPSWMWALSQRQVWVLLEALVQGDGSVKPAVPAGVMPDGYKRSEGRALHGTHAFLDQVQALLVVNGLSSRVTTNNRGDAVLTLRTTHRCFISKWDKAVSMVPYNGIIWCGTVENGTLITRRNGATLVSGNSTEKMRIATAADTSIEWLLFHMLAWYYRNEKRLEWQIADGLHCPVKIYNLRVRFQHGHAVRYQGGVGGLTIPLNKAIAQWNKGNPADLDVMGHWHQRLNGRDYVVNGSLIGFSPHSLSIKASFEPPCQSLFLVHPEYGKTVEVPIFLS